MRRWQLCLIVWIAFFKAVSTSKCSAGYTSKDNEERPENAIFTTYGVYEYFICSV